MVGSNSNENFYFYRSNWINGLDNIDLKKTKSVCRIKKKSNISMLWTCVEILQVCFDFEIPCNVSTSTVKVVSKCPTTVNEQEEAALRKNCAAIPNKCPKFEYHCVRNWLSTELYEVCAPPLYIPGKYLPYLIAF